MKPTTPPQLPENLGQWVDISYEPEVILFSAGLQCTQAWGKFLTHLEINGSGATGQPVTSIFAALAQAMQTKDNTPRAAETPSKETFRQLCQTAINGVESSFDFGPEDGNAYRVRLLPLRDVSGSIEGGMVLINSVPSEPRPETGLQRFIEAAPDAMIVTDTDGLIVLANSQIEAMFGYSVQALVGQPVEVLIPPRFHNQHVQHQRNYAASPQTRRMGTGFNLMGITQSGREFPVDVSLSPVPTPSGMLIISAIRDISAQKQIETALKQARDEFEQRVKERTADLERRNEELDAFAQTVAHDLKNPLAIMTGMAELMLQYYGDLSETELRKYLGLIARDGRRLDNIINELMVLSSLENLEPTLHPINVGLVAEEAIARLESMTKQYRAEIICNCNWPKALGYAPWIETVWVNYLSNAIKYGGAPPIIELGADVSGNSMIRYWIKDNGNGLSENEQTKLFTAFTRLGDLRVQGYGVGLSIVKRAVEKLGGQVGVESQVGKGSLFYFTLPAAESIPNNTL